MAPLKDKAVAVYARRLDLAYGEKVVFKGASFNIPANAKVALAGPNGSGKTTIIRMILGQESPDGGTLETAKWVKNIGFMPQALADADVSENISLKEFMLSGSAIGKIARRISGINTALAVRPDLDILPELGDLQDQYERAGGYQADWRIASIFGGLNLPADRLGDPVSSLSGGMKTRLFLARILFGEPDILILDEPTNHLDQDAIRWLGKFLHEYKGTVLIVSHQADFLDEFCESTLYINDQTHQVETYRGNYSAAKARKKIREEQQTKQGKLQEKERQRLQAFVDRWRAGSRAGQAQSRLKVLKKMKPVEVVKRRKQVVIKFPLKFRGGAVVVTAEKVVKDFGGGPIFPPLTFEVDRGDHVAVLGPNGSGKTSLLRIMAGRDKDFRGTLKLGYQVAVGYYSQEFESLNPKLVLLEQIRKSFPHLTYNAAMTALGHFLLAKQAEELISKLSQGEKARLALTCLFLSGANLLLLDEPTNHLDEESRRALIAAIAGFKGTIITVSHDIDYLRQTGIDKMLYVPKARFINGGLDMVDPSYLEAGD